MRVTRQNNLTPEQFSEAILMELEGVDEERLKALTNMLAQKIRISRLYNKRIRKKKFEVGELVWKVILPTGTKDREFGKWSPNWEGPFKVHQIGRAHV